MKHCLKMIACLVALCYGSQADAATTELISKTADGQPGNGESYHSTTSADGRFVVFSSSADLLNAGISGNSIYLHDRQTGLTEPIPMGFAGADVNKRGAIPHISGNGQFVVFSSDASNLVPNDTNGYTDVFVYDRQSGETQRVSIAHDGAQSNRASHSGRISSDGRFVVFVSEANNLVPGVITDSINLSKIYIHDRTTGATEHVSVVSEGLPVTYFSRCAQPDLSGDGRFVSFEAEGSNRPYHIYLHDRLARTTRIISNPLGDPLPIALGPEANEASMSADGRFVVFSSTKTDLVADHNGDRIRQIYVYDQVTNGIEMVSRNSDGMQGANSSYTPAISADGRFVAFNSFALNLAPGTLEGHDLLGEPNAFVRDRLSAVTEQVNVTSDGIAVTPGNYYVREGGFLGISADGRVVSFASNAEGLTNSYYRQIMVRDRDPGAGVGGTVAPLDPGSFNSDVVSGPESGPVGSNNIVVLVHGWLSSPDAWAVELGSTIAGQIDTDANTRWSVATFNWSTSAFVPTTWFAYANAVDLGKQLGNDLLPYDRIHFVAHSVGSAVVESAASWLRENSDTQPYIHTTLLDAYHPFPELATYGTSANWAEQYVDKRFESLGLSNTNLRLEGAFNFDVTSLDNRGLGLPGVEAHQWPHIWYQITAQSPTSWRYGWGASTEYDTSRMPSHADLLRGGECVILAPNTICMEAGYTVPELQFTIVPNPFDVWQSPSTVQVTQSDTGTVSLSTPQELLLTVGSPVWARLSADVTEAFNALSFSYEYLSGIDGLLSVFLDDQLVFRSDQRNSDGGLNASGLVPLGSIGPGKHALSFRLDHYSDSSASIRIFDIAVGQASFSEFQNLAPIAIAGVDQTSTVGGLVELNGDQSSDPDNGPLPLVYEWIQLAGPIAALRDAISSTPSFSTAEAGTYTFQLTVHDGHQTSIPSVVRVVASGGTVTAPVITQSTTGPLGSNGWYVGDVTVTWNVADGGAAISSSNGCDPVTVSDDTASRVLVCTATNSVGTSSEQVEIRRDSTNPVIAISAPASGATYTQSTSVAANYSCTDSLSGIASCIGTISDGAPLDTSTVGSRSFSVNATDAAGNSASTLVTYQVVAAPEDSSGGGGGGGGALDHWTLLFLSVFGLGAMNRRRQAH